MRLRQHAAMQQAPVLSYLRLRSNAWCYLSHNRLRTLSPREAEAAESAALVEAEVHLRNLRVPHITASSGNANICMHNFTVYARKLH